MSNDNLNILKSYEDVLGEYKAKQAYRNWCRVCYRHVKCVLYMFIVSNEVYVCVYWWIKEGQKSDVLQLS